MAESLKFELNRAGVRELLTSSEMMSICQEYANNARAKLGEGYSVDTRVGKNRVNAQISAQSYKAKRDNYKNNSIMKAVYG